MSILTPPSQIAERQLEYFSDKHVLVVGEVEDNFPQTLTSHCRQVSVFTTHYGYYRQCQTFKDVTSYFGSELTEQCSADMILLYWPKAKQEAQYLLSMILSKLGIGTEIVVVGENRSGVKSIEKMFSPFGKVTKFDSARRCSFYWGECESAPDTFILNDWFKEYQVSFQSMDLTIKSLPGVFSHGEFDLGSQLLLNNLPKLSGKVLDFGCGAGVLGCVMKSLNPEIELQLCDVSALAVTSTQETLKANGLSGHVFATDVYSDVESDFNFIVSNPPFHSGLDTSYNATETLLEQAPKHLKGSGELIIVANSFLKYPPIITNSFGKCLTLDKTNKFSIYQAVKTH
ncbi:16S rRNA (guanine(1207)-N(2))-methyltransferase RsmC [Vibrio viridaestus]|uniref:Ribosomal RNA small subunit methyltransferase C n=1 Tax=Vibrio viridaestus TaxID=2487322 RepID=A0A3N9TIV7_9VIBR|nr:16S rRNA (guanine(1207)-N(2))-methyltransferase RsmC [Vibrio viridaestus]RQW63843.1 16S rRNA (guanine(1207)-N(2))-methyltransferase RsmC [Vibrio viridaestus]